MTCQEKGTTNVTTGLMRYTGEVEMPLDRAGHGSRTRGER
jgi:hypothetical protein